MNSKKLKNIFSSKYKKEAIIISAVTLTFGGYLVGTKASAFFQKDEIVQEYKYDDSKKSASLQSKFISSSHIYMSDQKVDRIKIFESFKESLEDFFNTSTMSIRKPSKFKPIYTGLSSSGVKFSTDLDIIKFEYMEETMYYKVAEPVKSNFKGLLNKIIYFSPSSLKNYEEWNRVKVEKEDINTKFPNATIKKRDFAELASKISIVRQCGKIQPEKNNKTSKESFKVTIETDTNQNYTIYTMGKNYMKISMSKNQYEYFEVNPYFYDYLHKLFKEK